MPKPKPKYSPSDVHRFSNISADPTIITPDGAANPRLGNGKIGKVEVQCRFLHEESKWGRLENKDGTAFSAGIIHMEILFKNLHECALGSAVIRVVLDGDNQLLQSYLKVMGQGETEEKWGFKKKKKKAVEVKELGPRSIAGTPFGVVRRSVFTLNPAVDFQGSSFSAVEASKEKEWTQITRWVFEGAAWAHKSSRSDTVNSVEWSLSENVPEGQPSHGNRFRTAFVFANDGEPFFLRVEVNGCLRKIRHKAKEKLKTGLKFGSSATKTSPMTLIRGFERETQRLNKLAARLNEDMNNLNGAIDYNRRTDRQAHNPGPMDNPHLKRDEGDGDGDIRTEAKEPMDFVEMVMFMAESGNEYGAKNKGQGLTNNLKPASRRTQVVWPPTKMEQEAEARVLLHLLFQIWCEWFGRFQLLVYCLARALWTDLTLERERV